MSDVPTVLEDEVPNVTEDDEARLLARIAGVKEEIKFAELDLQALKDEADGLMLTLATLRAKKKQDRAFGGYWK